VDASDVFDSLNNSTVSTNSTEGTWTPYV
jgi:hypothetical protein